MEAMQLWAARIAGAAGVLLSLVAVVALLAERSRAGR